MFERLAEADARIEHHALDSAFQSEPGLLVQKRMNFPDDVFISGGDLHRGGRALHVHGDRRGSMPGDHTPHVRVSQARDVVNEVRTCLERRFGHLGLAGIHRDDGPGFPGDRANDGDHPGQFVLERDGGCPRSGRLPTDVDQVSSLGEAGPGAPQSILGTGPRSSVREGIGRDVKNGHDVGSGAPTKFTRAQFPDGRRRFAHRRGSEFASRHGDQGACIWAISAESAIAVC